MGEPNDIEDNNFTLAKKIEDMVIYSFENIKISLKNILDIIKDVKEKCTLSIPNFNLNLIINEIDDIFFSFSLGEKTGNSILRIPIKVKLFKDVIDIVCVEQLEHYLGMYFTKPCFLAALISTGICSKLQNTIMQGASLDLPRFPLVFGSFLIMRLQK